MEVECHGKLMQYEVLAILEFDSDRKRMSIICRCVCHVMLSCDAVM